MTTEGAIATIRFGLGARPDEITAASDNPQGWLLAQLTTESADRFPTNLASSRDALLAYQAYRQARRNRTDGADTEETRNFRRYLREIIATETLERAKFGAQTPAPFHERLTRFWSNHLSVSGRNRRTSVAASSYEREAIRPDILGSFANLAVGAILHPGMLIYLDNARSTGPNSQRGRRRDRGLNENLAREVLELHTVTPASGYSQEDVTEFAKALTGWTVGARRAEENQKGTTIFEARMHEPGARTVLGKTYRQSGGEQAIAIIRDLCIHPQTASNISYKLARHFVSDTPPPPLVERLTQAFKDTNGNLMALYMVLIDAPEAWSPTLSKIKTPEELLTSTARLIGIDNVFPGRPRDIYESFAQPPFRAPSPEGWPDTANAWIGPDAMLKRIEWANELAERMATTDARMLLLEALGPLASAATLQSVARAESGQQALVLALMSPDFQRR